MLAVIMTDGWTNLSPPIFSIANKVLAVRALVQSPSTLPTAANSIFLMWGGGGTIWATYPSTATARPVYLATAKPLGSDSE